MWRPCCPCFIFWFLNDWEGRGSLLGSRMFCGEQCRRTEHFCFLWWFKLCLVEISRDSLMWNNVEALIPLVSNSGNCGNATCRFNNCGGKVANGLCLCSMKHIVDMDIVRFESLICFTSTSLHFRAIFVFYSIHVWFWVKVNASEIANYWSDTRSEYGSPDWKLWLSILNSWYSNNNCFDSWCNKIKNPWSSSYMDGQYLILFLWNLFVGSDFLFENVLLSKFSIMQMLIILLVLTGV